MPFTEKQTKPSQSFKHSLVACLKGVPNEDGSPQTKASVKIGCQWIFPLDLKYGMESSFFLGRRLVVVAQCAASGQSGEERMKSLKVKLFT